MRKPLDIYFFFTDFFLLPFGFKVNLAVPKSCFYEAENQTAGSLWVGANCFTRFFFVKFHMGIEPFEIIFFSRDKFTKFELARKEDIKNRSKFI